MTVWLRPPGARRDAQDPGRPRLLFPPARRRGLPLRQHLRAIRQLRHRPGVHPAAPSPARRHHRTPRRRSRTRLAHRSHPPLTRHSQHPEPPATTHVRRAEAGDLQTAPECRLIECFFSVITRQAIRRGSFTSVKALTAAIGAFIDHWNKHPRPFAWIKDADEILASIKRAKTKANVLTDH